MSAEYKDPTDEEVEYMHGFDNLLASELWLADQIQSGSERDLYNEHLARLGAIVSGQQEKKEYE